MTGTIILLSIIGIIAIIAELVLPGGILGFAGVGCLIGAVALIFSEYGMGVGLAAAFALAVFCFTALWFWMKYFHRLPFTRKLVHRTEVGEDEGRSGMSEMIGRTGTTVTDLRPSGSARIDGQKHDVIAQSGFITLDSPVEVVGTSGASLIVRQSAE